AILVKAMAKDPTERFPDMAAMARALRKVHLRLGGAEALSTPSLVVPDTATPTPGISIREARLSAMVIVGRATAALHELQSSLDAPTSHRGIASDDATFIGGRFGGDVERLANGALALRFIEAAGATERALAAARCALALRARLPQAPISLATVRGAGGDDDVVRAIDRAAELVRDVPRSVRTGAMPIRIDETTAGLLDARFDVRQNDAGLELVSESGPGDESRKLLGVAVRCLGRDRELLTLDATLEEVEGERIARALIVIADAGVGKSRLRREWLHRVRERGDDVTLWIARADPLDSRAPHGLLGQAVRRVLAIADDAPAATKQARLREHLAGILSAAALERVFPFACEIIGAPLDAPPASPLAAARGDRALMAEHIRQAFEEWIIAECKRPLLVVLDDAHWSDAATLRLLDAALKAAADHPLLVAVFARPPLRTAHPTLFADRRVQELRLEELSKRSSERLARAILGAKVPQETIDRVVALSNGNAFFLEELVRAVAEGKGAQLPDSVLSVVEARLEALEPDARRVLRAASVFGQFFWPAGVAAVLGDDDEHASAWVGALARREIVSPRAQSRFDDEPEYTFRHALVRDTAYSMLTPEDREVAHRAAAAWLEARGEGEAAVLAAHLEAGGDPGRAAAYYMRAATQMLGSGELASARDLVSRGLACGPGDATRAELLMLDVEAHRWLGDIERSARAAEEAMLYANEGSETYTRALANALLSHLKLGNADRHRELLKIAMPLLALAKPTPAACRLASATGTGALFSGDLATAEDIEPIVSRLVKGDIDLAARAQLHVYRAFLSDARGDLEAQIQHFDAAATFLEQAGDARHALLHRTNASFARTLVGDYEDAAKRLFAVLADAEARGLRFIVDTAHADLSGTLERLGRFEEAEAHALAAIEGFQREGDQRMEGASRGYHAQALFKLGKTAHAFTEIHAGLALARVARQILPYMLASLANMELSVGSADAALEHAKEALDVFLDTRSDGAHEVYIRVAFARALGASGRADEAKAALAEAYEQVRHRLELIRDERYRASFERIDENAAVLAWTARER
ncbi:MAG TPA: AAA family ATPase, partial [Polyangiaceae bacterium]